MSGLRNEGFGVSGVLTHFDTPGTQYLMDFVCCTHSLTRYLRSTLRIAGGQRGPYTQFDMLFTQYPKDFRCPAGALHTV